MTFTVEDDEGNRMLNGSVVAHLIAFKTAHRSRKPPRRCLLLSYEYGDAFRNPDEVRNACALKLRKKADPRISPVHDKDGPLVRREAGCDREHEGVLDGILGSSRWLHMQRK
jgi:hypothetical protein